MKTYSDDIQNALEVLKAGGIILYPTDTIWGIGCDATHKEAVEKVYNLKRRKDSKSMLVLLDNANRLNAWVEEIPEIVWELLEVADKPMTIIYPKAKNLAENLINSDGTIGIRITTEEFSSELIRRFRKPLVSTSANISGSATAGNYHEIDKEIIDGVDYVVNYRQEEREKRQASSIIRVGLSGQIEILRK